MRKNLHTPWSDVIDLISFSSTKDADGFETLTETKRQVFCTFEEGVSQNEFYLAHKEGLRASASVELWTADYQNEEFVELGARRFRVLRAFKSSFDGTTLILSEVIR